MKVVIIGGVAGGAGAAARLRRNDENAQIIMLERNGFISFANCGRRIISVMSSPSGRSLF